MITDYLKYVNDQDPKAESKLTELLFIPMKQALKRITYDSGFKTYDKDYFIIIINKNRNTNFIVL